MEKKQPTQHLTIINIIFISAKGKLTKSIKSLADKVKVIDRIYDETRLVAKEEPLQSFIFTTYKDGKYDDENKVIIPGDAKAGSESILSSCMKKIFIGAPKYLFEIEYPSEKTRHRYEIRRHKNGYFYGTYEVYNTDKPSRSPQTIGMVKCAVIETDMNLYRTPNFDALKNHRGPMIEIPENSPAFKDWEREHNKKK